MYYSRFLPTMLKYQLLWESSRDMGSDLSPSSLHSPLYTLEPVIIFPPSGQTRLALGLARRTPGLWLSSEEFGTLGVDMEEVPDTR